MSIRSHSKPWWRDCESLGHVRSFGGAGASCVYCSGMAKRAAYRFKPGPSLEPFRPIRVQDLLRTHILQRVAHGFMLWGSNPQ